ncbi:hypothetical protein WG66_012857 [Moniliophthora roreri]|nr:hypothetical protein WG66_012857 [Moniliophthora roreri]
MENRPDHLTWQLFSRTLRLICHKPTIRKLPTLPHVFLKTLYDPAVQNPYRDDGALEAIFLRMRKDRSNTLGVTKRQDYGSQHKCNLARSSTSLNDA